MESTPEGPPPGRSLCPARDRSGRTATLQGWDTAPAHLDPADPSAPSAERQLAQLAAAVGPLRRVLAAIAARLLATKAHERLCYARLGDYARERAGRSPRQLQDLARVDRALAGLPCLERALVENRLPWSKVRLIARVASDADEAVWIARARSVATRRLEHEVRDRLRASETADPADEDPLTRVTLRCTPAVREKWERTRETAERVAGGRLCAGEVLELVAAEAFSSLSIDPERCDAPGEPTQEPRREVEIAAEDAEAPAACAPARALPRSIEALARDLEEADAFELDRRLRTAVGLEQTLDAAMAPLLRVVTSAEYEWRDVYRPLGSYARDQLGMSASKARTLLRLERAGDVCPELRETYRSGRLSWVKAQCLLPLLLLDLPGEWRGIWVALGRARHRAAPRGGRGAGAPAARRHALRLAALQVPPRERPGSDPRGGATAVCARDRHRGDAAARMARPLRRGMALPRGAGDAAGEAARRGRPRSLRRRCLRGDARPCSPDVDPARPRSAPAGPGDRARRLSLRGSRLYVAPESARPSRLLPVGGRLRRARQRCLHAGLLRVRGRAPDDLVFELGVRPNAPPLARYRSGDVALAIESPARASQSRAA